jgi:hypothetical protein
MCVHAGVRLRAVGKCGEPAHAFLVRIAQVRQCGARTEPKSPKEDFDMINPCDRTRTRRDEVLQKI